MFFKKNIHHADVEHHTRTAKKAIIYNAVACCAWLVTLEVGRDLGLVLTFFLMPLGLLVVVTSLYLHFCGIAYSVILYRKCKMQRKAKQVFAISAGPLVALLALLVWLSR